MGMTHGEPDTYPRTGDVMGFCQTKDAVAIAEAVVTVQRDCGDRADRKHARLKYTIEDPGSTRSAPRSRSAAGVNARRRRGHLRSPRPATARLERGRRRHVASHACIVPERPRARPCRLQRRLSALRRSRKVHDGQFLITPNQNLVLADIPAERQAEIDGIATRSRAAGAVVGPAPQRHGLRRAADLRSRAGGERALHARTL